MSSTFAAVFGKRLLILMFIAAVNSAVNAQSTFRLLSEKGDALEGALVTFYSLSSRESAMVISGTGGETPLPALDLPVVRQVQMLGYQSVTDTVKKEGKADIILKPAATSLGEVVVTGDYQPGYQANSVYQVDVITRDEIQRRGAVSVADLFTQELNMRQSSDPAMGSSLTMQGTGGEHIKFLIDGVPVTGRKNGNIDLGQLNLNNVERIEVVKGPMSVLYGSDALGGVINIITKKPVSSKINASINTAYEATGVYNADAGFGGSISKTRFNISGGRNFFDGWSSQDTGRWQQWKPKEQYFGDLRTSTTFRRTTLNFSGGYFREEVFNKSEAVITPYFAKAIDQNYRTWRINPQLNAVHRFSNISALQFTGAYSWYRYIKNTLAKNLVNLSEELTPELSDHDTTRFNTQFARAVYTLNPDSVNWNILAGAEFTNDNAIGQRIDGKEHTITDAALFASMDYRWHGLTIRPSARYIYNSRYDAPLVPAVHLLWKTGSFSWRAGWSAGFRAPSLKELYLSFFDNGIHNVKGNPNLEAENSDNFLLSSEYRKQINKYSLTGSISAFYNTITNRITLVEKDASTGLYMYDNLDEFYSRGAEWRGRISRDRISLEAGFAYTGTDEKINGFESQPEIAWYPEVNAGADYTMKKSATTFSVFWKYYGERPVYRYAETTPERFLVESYQMLDATVRQPLLKDCLQITLGVKNILNVREIRSASSGGVHSGNATGNTQVAMGTAVFARLSYQFK